MRPLAVPLGWFAVVVGVSVALAVTIVLMDEWPNDAASGLTPGAIEQPLTTPNTTRVSAEEDGDPFASAVAISQLIYPAHREQTKPGAVVLLNADDKATAIAATHILHFPMNAPILYVERDGLPDATREELGRLDPDGVLMDGNTQVYLVGDIGDAVADDVEDMGLETRRIRGEDPTDPAQNALALDEWASALETDRPDMIVVTNINQPEFGMPGASWNAHAGDSFLYVTDEGIPEATRDALEDRENGAFMYVFGGTEIVSDTVAALLGQYGIVDRVPGDTPQEVAVNFAGFRDAGTNLGWWYDNIKRDFGWGVFESGHGFTFANPASWQEMVSASIFSHMGKHTPMLLLNEDGTIPTPTRDYLEAVQPGLAAPDAMSFNHGWVIGNETAIPGATQLQLERLLRPKE